MRAFKANILWCKAYCVVQIVFDIMTPCAKKQPLLILNNVANSVGGKKDTELLLSNESESWEMWEIFKISSHLQLFLSKFSQFINSINNLNLNNGIMARSLAHNNGVTVVSGYLGNLFYHGSKWQQIMHLHFRP